MAGYEPAMDGTVYGYARVSTQNQHEDRQLAAMREYGVATSRIIVEKQSGKDFDRPGYQNLLRQLRAGDTLVIKSLDRLSRNKLDIKTELEYFKSEGIHLKVLDLPTTLIDLPDEQSWIFDMINNILIEVLSSIAEQERLTIHQRQREGIEAAKLKGKHLGRKPTLYPQNWNELYTLWLKGDITAKEFMRRTGLKKSTFYRMIHTFGKH